jgi:exonuclease I
MTQFATILTALEQAITGEPAPSFCSPEFRELLSAVTALMAPGIGPREHVIHEKLGRAAMTMLLDRLQASMTAERTLAIMRSDKPDAVC